MRVIIILGLSLLVIPPVSDRVTSAYQEKVVYTCSMHPEVKASKAGKCPKCGMKLDKTYQEKIAYTCSMHREVQSSKPGKCPKCGMKLVAEKPAAIKQQQQTTSSASTTAPGQRTIEAVQQLEEYTCPMHPEIRTTAAGTCPKCAMTLVPVTPAVVDDFNLKVESSPKAPKPNEKLRLRFQIFNPKTGKQVQSFYITHDKLFHLFVVSQDMSEFQHIHPTLERDGTFTIDTVLPKPGNYKIYSDFYPHDGAPQVLQENITTAGYTKDLLAGQPQLKPDSLLTKTVDGMKIELTLEPQNIIAGQKVTLKYHLTDVNTGQPVRDLVPYLGAWGHTLTLSEDQSDYVHSHPEEVVPENVDKSKLRGGPDATFNAFFPKPGIYRIWTQFQRGETLSTVSFTVKADRLH